ncbi:MAG: flagellar hook-basal body complex protein, partial [Planctomycetota bacterium]
MPKGVYAAASGMVAERRTLEVIAQNLAHAQTTGYRSSHAVRGRFDEYLAAYRGRDGGLAGNGGAGSFQADVYHDFSDGQRVQTDGKWDLALYGDGFFRVRDDQGRLLLTRVSSFVTDNANRLVTAQGLPVEGQGGPVGIPPDADRVSVDEQGRIYAYIPGDEGIA